MLYGDGHEAGNGNGGGKEKCVKKREDNQSLTRLSENEKGREKKKNEEETIFEAM